MSAPVRAVPVNSTHRIQSFSPMPQISRSMGVRFQSQTPPTFQPNNVVHKSQFEDYYNTSTALQPTTNISLLSKGISLLSITQLRDLLRDYSLPTGGNKKVLVSRLVIFLETFGQNQQQLLIQFSLKLKQLLAASSSNIEVSAVELPSSFSNNLSQELSAEILSSSPSCLFSPADVPQLLGPISLYLNQLPAFFNVTISPPEVDITPILQVGSIEPDTQLKRVLFQLNGVYITLKENSFWSDLTNLLHRQASFQIISIEPQVPVYVTIRWMRKNSIETLVQSIIEQDTPLPANSTKCNLLKGVCPLTRKLIKYPARGTNCAHSDCFDLSGYVCYSMKNNAWKCPICHKHLPAEDLLIDREYFKSISF